MTDPRLVAALAEALHHYRGTCELWTISEAACPIDHRVDAAAILPAFLADPRVAEWLAERKHEATRLSHPGATGAIAIEWRYLTDAERAYELADIAAILEGNRP